MEQKKIERINELSKKSKSVGLTEDERQEQIILRKQYIEGFKNNLKGTLDSIIFVDDVKNDKMGE